MSFFYSLACLLLKGFFRLFYRLSVRGVENIPKGKAIFAVNHASFFDPPLLAICCPEELHFLARSTLFQNRLWKYLLQGLNAHPIRRSSQDVDVFRMVGDLLKEEKKIVVFPEGERSPDGRIQPMKSGIALLAIRMQSPIIPVYLSGTFEAWPRHRKWPKFGTSITCLFGHPIDPVQFSHFPKKQAQEMIMEEINRRLQSEEQRTLLGRQDKE